MRCPNPFDRRRRFLISAAGVRDLVVAAAEAAAAAVEKDDATAVAAAAVVGDNGSDATAVGDPSRKKGPSWRRSREDRRFARHLTSNGHDTGGKRTRRTN